VLVPAQQQPHEPHVLLLQPGAFAHRGLESGLGLLELVQRDAALQSGSEFAEAEGFQYLVTLNSDEMPQELPNGKTLDGGGLFAFTFD
jgi:hypothetical protein